MRNFAVFGAIACYLTSGFAKAAAPASDQFYTFYGDVTAVDFPAHTITIKSSGKPLVFHVTPETKLSSPYGHVSLDKIKIGEGATVMMKLGEGNVGVAVRIRFDTLGSRSDYLKLFVARTIHEGVVSGMAINNYVAYQPPADGWSGSATFERANNDGVFLLEVRPDGTVSEVKMVKSMGYDELNLHAISWFKKWRFKPNTVTEVQIPMNYNQSKYPR